MLLLGVALVQEGDWGFGHAWIILGLVGIAAMIMTGAGHLGPPMGKLAELIRTDGPDAPSVQTRIAMILNVARIDTVVLVILIFVMVTKVGQ